MEGELCTISHLQTTFTMNDVLLTIIADVRRSTNYHPLSRRQCTVPATCCCWSLRKQHVFVLGSCSYGGTRSFGGYMGTCLGLGSGSF